MRNKVKMDRNKILYNIQRNEIVSIKLPNPIDLQITGINKLDIFKKKIPQTGGDCIEVKTTKALITYLNEHFTYATNFREKEVFNEFTATYPTERLAILKTVIIDGQFGVAENGSVWINDSNFPNRLIPFITEVLVLCLNSEQIVSDMHEAYIKINNAITGFGVFMSGPSKTSDIEQHLVYGAHGTKKLIVIINHENIVE